MTNMYNRQTSQKPKNDENKKKIKQTKHISTEVPRQRTSNITKYTRPFKNSV